MISDAERQRVARYRVQRERYLRSRQGDRDTQPEAARRLLATLHPCCPLLIALPLVLLVVSGVFVLFAVLAGDDVWWEAALWFMPLGIIGGVCAAVVAMLDWLSIPSGSRAKGVGFWYALAHLGVIALFAQAWFLAVTSPDDPGVLATALACTGTAFALLAGWLLGELHERLRLVAPEGSPLSIPLLQTLRRQLALAEAPDDSADAPQAAEA
jgi:uncharacterized membrane protein